MFSDIKRLPGEGGGGGRERGRLRGREVEREGEREKEREGQREGGGGGERKERKAGEKICKTYLMCNTVGSWYGHFHIVEAIGNGHILNDITRMDNI